MSNSTVLREVMADVFGLPLDAITEDASIDSIEAWDSLKHLNLVLALEEFNALNIDTVVNANQNFAVWQRPTQILNARVVKFSVQFDY